MRSNPSACWAITTNPHEMLKTDYSTRPRLKSNVPKFANVSARQHFLFRKCPEASDIHSYQAHHPNGFSHKCPEATERKYTFSKRTIRNFFHRCPNVLKQTIRNIVKLNIRNIILLNVPMSQSNRAEIYTLQAEYTNLLRECPNVSKQQAHILNKPIIQQFIIPRIAQRGCG